MGSSAEKGLIGWVFVVVVLMSLALTNCEGSKGYVEPITCGRLECVSYQVIHTQKDFEIRSYTSALWMSAPPFNSSIYREAASKGFKLLYSYIQGNNHQATKMNMTAPVLIDIYPSTGPIHNSSFVVHFYVSQKYQNSPPISDEVSPVRLPKHKYAAIRRFGGFLSDNTIAIESSALKESLKDTPWDSAIGPKAPGFFSVAGFNSMRQHENRVNEIILWFD